MESFFMNFFLGFASGATIVFGAMYVYSIYREDLNPERYGLIGQTCVSCIYIAAMGAIASLAVKNMWKSGWLNGTLAIILNLAFLAFIAYFICRILRELRNVLAYQKAKQEKESQDRNKMTLEEALRILANMEPSFDALTEQEQQAIKFLMEYYHLQPGDIYRITSNMIFKKSHAEQERPLEPCFVAMGFSQRPTSEDDLKAQYRRMAKTLHPDVGGDEAAFIALKSNYEKCLQKLRMGSHVSGL